MKTNSTWFWGTFVCLLHSGSKDLSKRKGRVGSLRSAVHLCGIIKGEELLEPIFPQQESKFASDLGRTPEKGGIQEEGAHCAESS